MSPREDFLSPFVITTAVAVLGGIVLMRLLRRSGDQKSPQSPRLFSGGGVYTGPTQGYTGNSRGIVAQMQSRDWARPNPCGATRPTPRITAARNNSSWNFTDVKREAEALRASGDQWIDNEFPPNDESLFEDPNNPPTDWLRDGERGKPIDNVVVQWKGPENFCTARRPLGKRADGAATWLYADADDDGVASCLDMEGNMVCQGSLGDCYFLSALAAAAKDKALADDLIDEEFEDVGIYGVSFWVDGRWEMIWVDRNFPCYRPTKASHSARWRLIFATCEDPKEIWPLVVEKAFAKLHDSYEAISGGQVVEALCALTGGRGSRLNLQSPFCNANRVFEVLTDTKKNNEEGTRFVGAGSRQRLNEPEARGIISAHAYTVLDACNIEGVRLVKIRNPWNRGEWKGDWSDGNHMWHSDVGRKVLKAVGLSRGDDGEFWMSITDFLKRFATVEFCDVRTEGRETRLKALRASMSAAVADGKEDPSSAVDDRDIDDLLADIEGKKRPAKKKKRRKH